MTLPDNYLDRIAEVRDTSFGPFAVPWPMPGDAAAILPFDTLTKWREFILSFSLTPSVPLVVSSKFMRAQKLFILAWVDFDLIKAGELVAFTALELTVTDRYAGVERERRKQSLSQKEEREKKKASKGEKWWADNPSFADLLKFMVDHDGLTDGQLPINHRCGPPSNVVALLTGERRPSLSDMRNELAHGAPLGGFPRAGLLEVIRDLIAYAYRDWESRRPLS